MLSSCGTTPIEARAWRGLTSISKPQIEADPDVFSTRPARMLMNVDLPAPFGPSSAKIEPRGMARSIPFSASLAGWLPLAL